MNRNDQIEACARAGHAFNREYCIFLDDLSQPHWEDAPEWQRTSARNGVEGVLRGNGPRQSHDSWLAEKEATGWKYGPTKDPEAKEHPCFVPYDDLPESQRRKDEGYVAAVTAMAKVVGLWPASGMDDPRVAPGVAAG